MKNTEVKSYLTVAEVIEKSGYKVNKPKIGSLGKALMAASREHSEEKWLKTQIDIMFSGIRREEKKERRKQKWQN